MTRIVRVAAAVMFDAAGRVLIAQRPDGGHMPGYWEFPGGKLEPHESAEQALARELLEEIGVELCRCHRLLQLRHDYGDRVVELEVFVVDESRGEPSSLEGQPLEWVSVADLWHHPLLPADRPIIEALNAYEGTVHGAGQRIAGHTAR